MDNGAQFDPRDYVREQERLDCAKPEPEKDSIDSISDDTLALQFANLFAEDLRYTASWAKWHVWDGTRWAPDSTLATFDEVRALCRRYGQMLSHTLTDPEKRRLGDAKTIAAVERLARSDRRFASTVDQWDADPNLLTTPNGTVNLTTGMLGPSNREDYATKSAAVAPDSDAECPVWLQFLNRVTGENPELIDYLQRLSGYAITGSVREHMLAFFYGDGANGKGTLLNTLTAILGDYATVAPANMFEATHSDRHPTEMAMLRGARLVAAQETEEGRLWAEARIKSLTGGDPITARHMRQDFFTFEPQFTLLIAGNHKPGLRNVDEAIKRRLHLVPFTVQIPESERDPALPEKLQAEWPAILAWMIRGCIAWQKAGLHAPAIVKEATAEYLAGCDAFSLWLEECTQTGGDFTFETTADLFASWKLWAEAAGEPVGNKRRFSERMRRAGFEPAKKAGGNRDRGYRGITLTRQNYTDDARNGR